MANSRVHFAPFRLTDDSNTEKTHQRCLPARLVVRRLLAARLPRGSPLLQRDDLEIVFDALSL